MIDRITVDKIFTSANIVDVINDFVTLKKKGQNYSACCPFHGEKTPSFVVSPAKGLFKCFGCGKGGNAITFVMEHEKMTYVEALKYVAKKYAITIEERAETEEEKQRNDDRESMMIVNSWANDYFSDTIFNTDKGKSIGKGYFAQRGITDAIIKRFGLGFCPDEGDTMTRAALQAGYQEKYLVDTGLTIKRETGGYYDRFCGRAMFPIHTISGRVTAFSGRALNAENKAKYVNSPDSTVYSKSNNLYGIYFAKSAITKANFCIIVEGNLDVVQMHQKGIENVVAPLGTALTVEQVRLIHRFTPNITLLFDGDSAGVKAALKGVDLILKEGMNVRVVVLPDGEDPDSFARKHSTEEVSKFIEDNERDFIRFKSTLFAKEAEKDPIKKAALISDIIHSISEIPDKIQRSVFAKDCAKIMDIDEGIIINEIARKRISVNYDSQTSEFVRNQQARQSAENKELTTLVSYEGIVAGSSMNELEKEIVGYLLKYGHSYFDYQEGKTTTSFNVAKTIFDELASDGIIFQNRTYEEMKSHYCEHYKKLGEGVEVPNYLFVNHVDVDICSASVDILSVDDNLKQSKIWKKHDIFTESEEDRLSVGLPRAIMIYRSKAIEFIIKGLKHQLNDETLSDEAQIQIITDISALNKERTKISKKISRTIL